MKKQTLSTKLFLLLTLFVMLMQSCTKDLDSTNGNVKTTYHYLTAAQLNQTPYFTNPAFDTISFASDKGDTLTFVKTKTDTTWYRQSGLGNPDRGYDQDYYQTISNKYNTIKGIGSFYVKHVLQDGSVWKLIGIYFNNISFESQDYWINWSEYPTYQENYFLNNYNYKSSIIIYVTPSDTSISDKGYINKDFGLYSVNNKNENITWSIIKS